MMNLKDSEGSDSYLIVVVQTEENDEHFSIKLAGVPVDIRTKLLPNTSPQNYLHVSPFSAMILKVGV
jgi:hypothetical protein